MEKEVESLKQKIINNGTIQTFTSIERNGIANFLWYTNITLHDYRRS